MKNREVDVYLKRTPCLRKNRVRLKSSSTMIHRSDGVKAPCLMLYDIIIQFTTDN